jgi:maltooligosyltrehalose trehalohydrolase
VAPFLYFVSHSDPDLIEAVRTGRKKEFAAFISRADPPDPESVETFLRSKLDPEKRKVGNHAVLLRFYRELIGMRKTITALAVGGMNNQFVSSREEERLLWMERWKGKSRTMCFFNFNERAITLPFPGTGDKWLKLLDSAEQPERSGFSSAGKGARERGLNSRA